MKSQLSHDALKPLRLTSRDVKCVIEGMAYIVTVKTLTKLLYWTYVDVLIKISIFVM